MEMRYFCLLDGETQQYFKFYYHPGLENLGDYPSKHHTADIISTIEAHNSRERLLAVSLSEVSWQLDSSIDMPEGALNSLVGKIARKAVNRESPQWH